VLSQWQCPAVSFAFCNRSPEALQSDALHVSALHCLAIMLKVLSTSHKRNQCGVDDVQDLGHKISSYTSALFQPPEPSVKAPPLSRDPSRCLDYTPDLQRSAGMYCCTASQFLHCCISLTQACSTKLRRYSGMPFGYSRERHSCCE